MNTWIIGDIHGQYLALEKLLKAIDFQKEDRIICVGDLINRGSHSAEVLDFFFKSPACDTLLGNHDWAFLFYYQAKTGPHHLTFSQLGQHRDVEKWMSWLKSRRFFAHDIGGCSIVHAGLWPYWTLEEHQKHAHYLQKTFLGAHPLLLKKIDDHLPHSLDESYDSEESYCAFLLNVFTKMRYLKKTRKKWSLALAQKGHPDQVKDPTIYPWYEVYPQDFLKNQKVLFGHWSTLKGLNFKNNIIGLDTGCGWGKSLSAYHIESGTIKSVDVPLR